MNRGYNFLVLTFSVVVIGSPLAYVEKRGRIHLNFASLHLCDLALDQMNEKDEGDARAQRMKNPFFWHPFKKTTESIRIRQFPYKIDDARTGI